MSNSATFSPTCASPSRSRGSRSPRHVQAVTMGPNFRSGGTIPGSRTLPPFCAWGAHSVTSFSDRLSAGTMRWKVGRASCLSRTARGGQWRMTISEPNRLVWALESFGTGWKRCPTGTAVRRSRFPAASFRLRLPSFASGRGARAVPARSASSGLRCWQTSTMPVRFTRCDRGPVAVRLFGPHALKMRPFRRSHDFSLGFQPGVDVIWRECHRR